MNFHAALAKLATARNMNDGKPVQNNTRIVKTSTLIDGQYVDGVGVKLHATIVVNFLPDGTEILSSGGWYSNTTADRIRGFATAHLMSQHGYDLTTGKRSTDYTRWVIGSDTVGTTPAKVQSCRTCKGEGKHKHVKTHERSGGMVFQKDTGNWDMTPTVYTELAEPVITFSDCYRCQATGQVDYGSIRVSPEFEDGVRLSDGIIVSHGHHVYEGWTSSTFDKSTGTMQPVRPQIEAMHRELTNA